MNRDPQLDAIVRHARAQRVSDAGGRCTHCGIDQQLVAGASPTVCYEHRDGAGARVELDHLAGVASLPAVTIALRANAHRRVTELRALGGKDEWPPAEGDPLLVLAHLLAGLASLVWLLAEWLKDVVVVLSERLGPEWYGSLPPFPFPM